MSKNMFKKYIALIIVFFSWVHFANAGFEITEIMYDLEGTDTNREWIEVKNTGSESTDLSKWFFFSDNTKHALVPQGASSVPAGGYAIIAQNTTNFMADWPSFEGLLFDSSWTGFNNEAGEEIALKDPDLNLVSPVTFTSSQGGAGDGDSLQNINGSWTGGTPTPGAVNQGGSSGDEEEEEGGGSTSSSEEDVVVKKKVEVPKMKTKIIVKNTVVAGVPLKIDSITEGYEKETLKVGKFSWNFGDGMSKEESEAKQFEYTYTYPGEYVLTLAYNNYYHPFNTSPDASDRVIIKVLSREVAISSVGSGADTFVELENKSGTEIDLSKWSIQAGNKIFYIPSGTAILANKKIKFSPKVTLFTGEDINRVTLSNATGETFATYPSVKTNQSYTASRINTINTTNNTTSKIPASSVINLDNLGASAGKASNSISTSTLAWLGLIGIIIIASISVYLIRRKNSKDEYVGDSVIRASDMTIVE